MMKALAELRRYMAEAKVPSDVRSSSTYKIFQQTLKTLKWVETDAIGRQAAEMPYAVIDPTDEGEVGLVVQVPPKALADSFKSQMKRHGISISINPKDPRLDDYWYTFAAPAEYLD